MSSSSKSLFTPRIATLILALLGIIVHLNLYSWLGTLNQSLPDVVERPVPPISGAPLLAHPSRLNRVLLQHGGSSALDAQPPTLLVFTNPKAPLPTSTTRSTSSTRSSTSSHTNSPSAPVPAPNAAAAAVAAAESFGRPFYDDGAEDAERLNWDALRLSIRMLRAYILVSVLCCLAGILGVLRSHLSLSRLFVLHSFLDLLLSTLSLGAFAILSTHSSVRSHLCDEFISDIFKPQPIQTLDQPPNSSWDTMLDGLAASENCEDLFRSTIVPLAMIIGLTYTALRLQSLFIVQKFHNSLLRTHVLTTSSYRDRRWKQDKLFD